MNGSSKKDSPYVRKMPGATSRTSGVGAMNSRTISVGNAASTNTHSTPKTATVPKAYRRTSKIRLVCRAP